ncbi:MAG TPA: hypothetical protein PLQ67_02485 [Burkholderiaceae bacterium]|nr:hypothetical protein [Burkholderiaceae bacterium]
MGVGSAADVPISDHPAKTHTATVLPFRRQAHMGDRPSFMGVRNGTYGWPMAHDGDAGRPYVSGLDGGGLPAGVQEIKSHFEGMSLLRAYDPAQPRRIDVRVEGDPQAMIKAVVERDGVVSVQRFSMGGLSVEQAGVFLARALHAAHTGTVGSVPSIRLSVNVLDPDTGVALDAASIAAYHADQTAGQTPMGQAMHSALRQLGLGALWMDYVGTPPQLAISVETAPATGVLAPPGGDYQLPDFGLTPNGALAGAASAVMDAREPAAMVNAYRVGRDVVVTALRPHAQLESGVWLSAALRHQGIAPQVGDRVVLTDVGSAQTRAVQTLMPILEAAGYVVSDPALDVLPSGQVNLRVEVLGQREIALDPAAGTLALAPWRKPAPGQSIFDANFVPSSVVGQLAEPPTSGQPSVPLQLNYSPLSFYGDASPIAIRKAAQEGAWEISEGRFSATVDAHGALHVNYPSGWATRAEQGQLQLRLEALIEQLHMQQIAVVAITVRGPHAQTLVIRSLDEGMRSQHHLSDSTGHHTYTFKGALEDGQLVQLPDGRYGLYDDRHGLQLASGRFYFVRRGAVTTVSSHAVQAQVLEQWRGGAQAADLVGIVSFDAGGRVQPSEQQWIASKDQGWIEVAQGPANHPHADLPGLYHLNAGFFPHGTEAPLSEVSIEALIGGPRRIVPGYSGVRVPRVLAEAELALLQRRLGGVEVLARTVDGQVYYFSGNQNAVMGDVAGQHVFSPHHNHPGDPERGLVGTPRASRADQANLTQDFLDTLIYFPQAKLEPSYVLTLNEAGTITRSPFGPIRPVQTPAQTLHLVIQGAPQLRVAYRSVRGVGIARIGGLESAKLDEVQANVLQQALIAEAQRRGDVLLSSEYELDAASEATRMVILHGLEVNQQANYDFTSGEHGDGLIHVFHQEVSAPTRSVSNAEVWSRLAGVLDDGVAAHPAPTDQPPIRSASQSGWQALWPQAVSRPKDPQRSMGPSASPHSSQSDPLPLPREIAQSLEWFKQTGQSRLSRSLLMPSLRPNPRNAAPEPPRIAKALLEADSASLHEMQRYLAHQQALASNPALGPFVRSSQETYIRFKALVNNNRGTLSQLASWLAHVSHPGETPLRSLDALIEDRVRWAKDRPHVRQTDDSIEAIAAIARISERRLEALGWMAQGFGARDLAVKMGIDVAAASIHFNKNLEALGAFSWTDLKARYPGGLQALARRIAQFEASRYPNETILPGALDRLPRSHLPILADLAAGHDRRTIREAHGLTRRTLNDYVARIHTRLGVGSIDELKVRYTGVDLQGDALAAYKERPFRANKNMD